MGAFYRPAGPWIHAGNNRGKWAVFHYLDWNVSNKFPLVSLIRLIWYDKDNAGNSRGFDVTYLNPVIFLRPLEASNGSPDNALIGFTGKYKIANGITAYGQFFLDEFQAKQFFGIMEAQEINMATSWVSAVPIFLV